MLPNPQAVLLVPENTRRTDKPYRGLRARYTHPRATRWQLRQHTFAPLFQRKSNMRGGDFFLIAYGNVSPLNAST